jgi:hypothetical protein
VGFEFGGTNIPEMPLARILAVHGMTSAGFSAFVFSTSSPFARLDVPPPDRAHEGQLDQNRQQYHNETAHSVTRCKRCHKASSFKDMPASDISCQRNNHHEKGLGANCALCHMANAWTSWRFGHTNRRVVRQRVHMQG